MENNTALDCMVYSLMNCVESDHGQDDMAWLENTPLSLVGLLYNRLQDVRCMIEMSRLSLQFMIYKCDLVTIISFAESLTHEHSFFQ